MDYSEGIYAAVQAYLLEDVGAGDITAAIVPEEKQANAEVITREPMVICGQAWFNAVFAQLDATIQVDWRVEEGAHIAAGQPLCFLAGRARPLLTGERTALNLLQTLSATATVSRSYADAVAGTGCKVLDTRKTLPGLRLAQKYAVRCGGCYNHRAGLYDAVLIKENHILATGSISNAVRVARELTTQLVEVEVETLQEFQQALAAGPDRIMLDNFAIADLQRAVAINQGKIALEASGNIELHTIRKIAETGVQYISTGALTKNVRAIDLSMRIQLNGGV